MGEGNAERVPAVVRGALAAGLWAAALCACSALNAGVFHVQAGYAGSFLGSFSHADNWLFTVPMAAAAGAVAGSVGEAVINPSSRVRLFYITLALVVSTGLVFALVVWLGVLTRFVLGRDGGSVISVFTALPTSIFLVLFWGLPWFLPGLAVPVLGAGALIEGWTRAPGRPTAGLGDAARRTRLIVMLVLLTTLAQGIALAAR